MKDRKWGVMADNLVSVVVPSYRTNPESLQRCLESIGHQQFSDTTSHIECLVVFDGEPDSELVEMVNNSGRSGFVTFRGEIIQHAGVSVARNHGIEVATGEWIAFVDADDELLGGALETMVKFGSQNDCDIIQGTFTTQLATLTEHHSYMGDLRLLTGDDLEVFRKDTLMPDKGAGSVWAKIFRRAFLIDNDIQFDSSIAIGEDTAFVFSAALAANSVGFVPREIYCYHRNTTSAVTTFHKEYVDRIIKSMNAMCRLTDKSHGTEDYAVLAQDYILFHLLLIQVHYLFHPGAPWSNAERKAEYRHVLGIPMFHEALQSGEFHRFGIAKRISLQSLKHEWYFISKIIALVRRYQLAGA